MQLKLGCPVTCSDGPFGELADIVIDPTRRRVTHLVIEPHHRHRLARLVSVRLASADQETGEIVLDGTVAEIRDLPPVEEFAYLRLAEFPVADPEWEVGIERVLAQPYYDGWGVADTPLAFDPHVSIWYDRIPKGEIEIRRSSGVFSAAGRRLGHVDGFLVDAHDKITHVVLERGHVFGRREVAIPIGAVARVANDSVTLSLTKDEVRRLRAVPVKRWAGRVDDKHAA